MYLYKKSQKFPVQIALYGTCPKIKKSFKNWFRPLGVNKVTPGRNFNELDIVDWLRGRLHIIATDSFG
jgi:hypothetical protein